MADRVVYSSSGGPMRDGCGPMMRFRVRKVGDVYPA